MTGFGFTGRCGPVQTMPAPHSHADLEINYLTDGSLTYLLGGRVRRIPARTAAVFWGAIPHHVLRSEGSGDLYWFTIPFAWVLAWNLPAETLRRLLTGEVWMGSDGITESACQRWHGDLTGNAADPKRACELEIQASLLRLAAARRPSRTSRAGAATGPVERMAAFIAAHFTDSIDIADITRASGLQSSYAMTLFRRTCGLTLLEYVIQHRIFYARRLLVTTSRTVLDVALASGFGSLSRFHEAFKESCGCSPGQFRKVHAILERKGSGQNAARGRRRRAPATAGHAQASK